MKLSSSDRKSLPKSAYGLPQKAPGAGSYPMPDAQHASLAKSFAKRFASLGQEKEIDAKANKVLKRKQRGKVRKV